MPAISIRERMYSNEAVVQPHGNFIRRERIILNPVENISEHMMDNLSNLDGVNADVSFGGSIRSRPIPNIAEHSFVQLQRECLT